MRKNKQEDIERITERKSSECWEWQGYRNHKGYGRVSFEGRSWLTHRLFYTWYKGKIKKHKLILHHCDNPACVNPDHLYQGTDKDNAKDRKTRNREGNFKGSKNGRARLTENQVRKIRALWKTGKYTQTEIGKMFEVDYSRIWFIVTNRQWKHVK